MNPKQSLEFLATLVNNYIQTLPPGVKESVVAQAQPAMNMLVPLVEPKADEGDKKSAE